MLIRDQASIQYNNKVWYVFVYLEHSISMETEEPKAVRRKLNPEEEKENEDKIAPVEFRQIGETFREYFV